MRRICKILLIAFVLFGIDKNTAAWDSTAAKYMPLQVGNVWVYSSSFSSFYGSGSSFKRYSISGKQIINGRVYHILNFTQVNISGTYSCGSRLFTGSYAIRIDSVSMNLYKQSECNSSSEGIVDSLASGIGDTSLTCFIVIGAKTVLSDTSDYFIFDTYFNAKKFTSENGNGGIAQTYLEGIGLARYYFSVSNEICNHVLKGCIINGVVYGDTSMIVGISQLSTEIPKTFELSQNYPNPFNPVTKIKFNIPQYETTHRVVSTSLIIYDAIGKEVAILVNQQLQPGTYEAYWDASVYPSGVYYYRLQSGTFTETKKMLLIK